VDLEGKNLVGEKIIEEDLLNQGFPVCVNGEVHCGVELNKIKATLVELGERLTNLWEKRYTLEKKIREEKNKRLNKRLGVKDIQFQPLEFVLISRKGVEKNPSKLKLTWYGPFQVLKPVGRNTYEVEDPLGRKSISHSSRMRKYATKDFKLTEEVKKVYLQNMGDYYLERIEGLKEVEGQNYLKCKWYGLEERSWEPFHMIWEDCEDFVRKYLRRARNKLPLAEELYRTLCL